MKILRVVSSGYEQGGAENGVVLTNDILRRNGHEVKVFSSNARSDLKHFSDYEFSTVPSRGIKKLIYAAFNYDAYKLMKKVLKEFQPDVVLLHTMSQPTAAILFPLKKYPTALFVHGPEIFVSSLLPWNLNKNDYKKRSNDSLEMTLRGRLHYVYFKYVCATIYKIGMKNVNQMIGLSKYTVKLLNDEGYSSKYIPNGAKILKPVAINFNKPVLMYAGRLEKFKGIDSLIRAMPSVLLEIPEVTLRIAGEGDFYDELRELCIELKIENKVVFLKHLNGKALYKEYARCTLFVFPSVWPETFGKVGIEAMSIGRPVIATDVGGIRDWLIDGKNGYLVEPNRPSQITARVVTLLKDKKKTQEMAYAAIKTADKFSIENMAANIESLIKSLTS